MKVTEDLEVRREFGRINFEVSADGARIDIPFSPIELSPILMVLRGMSEYEKISDYLKFRHVLEPHPGYILNAYGTEVFIPIRNAFILMLGLEHAIGTFI